MHKRHAIDIFDEQRFLGEAGPKLMRAAGIVGIVGLLLALVLGLAEGNLAHFYHAYLINFLFVLTIAVGSIFFLLTQHLTRAGWSVAFRRIAELLAATVPLLAVLALPILLPLLAGNSELYRWNDPKYVEANPLVAAKQVYLNAPAFVVRAAIYFLVWSFLARYFLVNSVKQDTDGDPNWTSKMQAVSAPGAVAFALVTTFAAFDFLMSLLPAWYSTIFGVYFFAGCTIAFFTTIILASMIVQGTGRLVHAITTEHYHDLGKLLFSFVVFWAYIAFSQFMLIWYANIPEETVFYELRWATPQWRAVSLVLVFGHFIIPFLGLVSRHAKRRRFPLAFWAIWLLVMHWIDLYWLVMPNLPAAQVALPLPLIELASLIGMCGLFVAAFAWLGIDRSLVPARDPRLADSLALKNA